MSQKLEFLYLSEEDMIKAGVLDAVRCGEVMEEVFQLLGEGDYLMGGPLENSHGLMLHFPEEKRGKNMPVAGPERRAMTLIAYLGGRFNVMGNKWYGSNIDNKDKGLPRSILNITLNDSDTGAPLCYCSGNLVSAIRTGAVPGVATKYLQADGASVVGVIGAGVISRACMLAIAATLRDKKEARVYDLFPEKAAAFCDELRPLIGMDIHPVGTLREACEGCDIISVAAAGSNSPKIEDEWLKDGVVIELTGGSELSDDCYKNNKIVADNWKMYQEWLEERRMKIDSLSELTEHFPIIRHYYNGWVKDEDVTNLGDIVCGRVPARASNKEKIIFTSGGMAVEDVAWAFEIYSRALEMNIGQRLTLWEKPYWS